MAVTGRNVVIVGQGYVGLPVALRAVEVGHRVVGVDVDERRVKMLSEGESYIEDVSAERLTRALRTNRYLPTTDYSLADRFDVAVITVPTPLRDSLPDLSFVTSAGRALAPYVRPGCLVVLESTTYPGTTQELLAPLLESGSGLRAGRDFHLAYSPERIDPGNPTWTLVTTPKLVSGVDAGSLAAVQNFYRDLVRTTVAVSTPQVAELAKLLENTFRHVNIALVNEVAVFAHQLGIDIWEAVDAASTKPFGFMRFTPGPGVGGHCLPIDPSFLSWQVRRQLGRSFRFVELANDINDHMPDHVVTRIVAMLNRAAKSVRGSRILLLGLAYKPNTGDARESPALRVLKLLCDLGGEVRFVDPHVVEECHDVRARRVDLCADEVRSADLVVLLTDHRALDLDLVCSVDVPVLDCRGRLSGAQVERL
jgi:UDP-N-acetyl-D-glucosamine dehydrogenase